MPIDVIQNVTGTVVVTQTQNLVQTTIVPPNQVETSVTELDIDARPDVTQVVELVTAGPQGPPGPAGPSSQGIPPIDYAYGDAAGAIFTSSGAGTITLVRLTVSTSFDGASPSLVIGTLLQPSALLAAVQSDLTTLGEYEHTPDYHLNAYEAVRLTITPGVGALQGAGTILLQFVPD